LTSRRNPLPSRRREHRHSSKPDSMRPRRKRATARWVFLVCNGGAPFCKMNIKTDPRSKATRPLNDPMKTYNPRQAAIELKVTTSTVYGWIHSGRMQHERVRFGRSQRIKIPQFAIEMMRLDSAKNHDAIHSTPEQDAWVSQFRNLFGAAPPYFLAWRCGTVTFDQMKTEAQRRGRIMFG
jgi:excisionase family DNA binding protein